MPNMGTKASPRPKKQAIPRATSLADALFSGTQQRVLGHLFGQPARSFYATELIGLTKGGSGAVQRELARLAGSGLVSAKLVGNQKHYQANPDSPLYAELCAIAQKTVGLGEPLRDALRPLVKRIHAAFIFGSVAKGKDTAASDVDLMVISDRLTYGNVYAALEPVGLKLGRPVNPTILTRKELGKRVREDSAFVKRVLSQPKIWLIGSEDDLSL